MSRRFREETITDLMMASLATAGAGRIRIDFPNETTTGADMEWIFINEDDGSYYRYLIQAKKLYGSGRWRTRSYRHLVYQAKNARQPQALVLAQYAANTPHTYPLYAFYNPQSAIQDSYDDLHGPVVKGVNIADGYLIASMVANKANLREKRIKSLGFLAPVFSGLESLFCPETIEPALPYGFTGAGRPIYLAVRGRSQRDVGVPAAPTPEIAYDRIRLLRAELMRGLSVEPDVFPPAPEPGRLEAEGLDAMMNGTAPSIARIRVLFVSRRPQPVNE